MAIASVSQTKILLGETTAKYDQVLTQLSTVADAAVIGYVRRGRGRGSFASWPSAGSDTIYLSGNNHPYLQFPLFPLNSVASIYMDSKGYYGQGTDPFPSSTLLTAGTHYVVVFDDGGSSSSSAQIVRLSGSGSAATPFDDGDTGGWFGGGWMGAGFGGGLLQGSLSANGRRPAVWRAGLGNIKITANVGWTTLPEDMVHAANTVLLHLFRSRLFGREEQSVSFVDSSFSLVQPSPGFPELGTVRQLLNRYREVVF